MKNLIKFFSKTGYEISEFPEKILKQEQNISVKFSPEDLIVSKIKAGCPKDLLDIKELKQIKIIN